MKVRTARIGDAATAAEALIVPVFATGSRADALPPAVRSAVERLQKETTSRRLYSVMTHFGEGKPSRVVVVQAGKWEEWSVERARNVASAGVKSLWTAPAKSVAVVVVAGSVAAERAIQASVEGVVFALWRPEAHRTREEERRLPALDEVVLLTDDDAGGEHAIARGHAVGDAVNVARRLANEPANKMTPTLLAKEAEQVAKASGVDYEVFDRGRCEALGMGSYLSVAQGSHEPPQFIVLRYKGRGGSGYDLALVGKGITFDSGGISIKPADRMHLMKADMTGGAAVIAAMGAIGKLRPKANVIGVVPATENLPGGGATKPGDVFTSMGGRSIEVINTDAEGRLVLVDGITYVQREGAKRVVDVATLTGAMAVGLGHHYSGVFGKPQAWIDEVLAAADEAGDKVWPMPLSDEYRDEIKSDIADLSNSAGREGGAIKAAAFLDAHVEDGTEWAHFDIAGTYWADADKPQRPKGPQGPVVRTLVRLAERLAVGGHSSAALP